MAAVMSAMTVVLCIGLGVFVKYKATQTVIHEFAARIENLNLTVSELLSEEIVSGNQNALREKIAQIGKIHNSLAAITIQDAQGNLLIDWRNPVHDQSPSLSFSKNINDSGKSYGVMSSRWSTQNSLNEIDRRWKTVVFIVFGFCLLLGVHLLVAMRFTLFNPLRKIEERLTSFRDRDVASFIPRSHWTSVEFNSIEAVADLLEQEIKARLIAEKNLQAAKNVANQANDAKSLFLANMSHELRTPLNAILGYSELLQELAQEKGENEFIDDLQKIHKSGHHLLQLVNDLLDLSKIEAGKIIIYNHVADTRDIAMELLDFIQPMVKASNSRIVCNFDSGIKPFALDTLRFRQIMFNLLSNAAKFTKNGLIELSILPGEKKEEGYVIYRVRDTGIGIAPDKLDSIFDDFIQANADTSHHYGGTGLGLAISNKLSQLMGGNITVTSKLGAGSTFTLKLPTKWQDAERLKSA